MRAHIAGVPPGPTRPGSLHDYRDRLALEDWTAIGLFAGDRHVATVVLELDGERCLLRAHGGASLAGVQQPALALGTVERLAASAGARVMVAETARPGRARQLERLGYALARHPDNPAFWVATKELAS